MAQYTSFLALTVEGREPGMRFSLVRTAVTLSWQGQLSVLGQAHSHPALAESRGLGTISSFRSGGLESLPHPLHFSHPEGAPGKSTEPENLAQVGSQTPP